MASPDPSGTRRAARSASRFHREHAELQSLVLGALAHELGNLASPVTILADTVAIAPDMERIRHAGRTLQVVAERLRQLTALVRVMRGDRDAGLTAPAAMNTTHFFQAFVPILESLLPSGPVLETTVEECDLSAAGASTLCWCLAATALHLAAAVPDPEAMTLTVQRSAGTAAVDAALTVRTNTSMHVADSRWVAYAAHIARRGKGSMREIGIHSAPGLVFSVGAASTVTDHAISGRM